MKIIRNKFIPFKGFKAINLFGVLFVRGNAVITEKTIRHESIHTAQMKEMLYVGFYIAYLLDYMYRICWYAWKKNKRYGMTAYDFISFEREAYAHDKDKEYLKNRKRFAWTKFL